MSSARKAASVVSVNSQPYSWRYHQSGIVARSSARNSAEILGQASAGTSTRCQVGPPAVHSWWKNPRLPKGVDSAIRRPSLTASMGRTP